jgi:O-antigen/teichoic acid export membrane protein
VRLAATGSRILLWRALQKLAGALTVLVIAQGLGPAGNGRYSLTLLVMTVTAAVLAAGVGLASVPRLRRGEDPPTRLLAAQAGWLGAVTVVLVGVAAVARGTGAWGWLAGSLGWDTGLLAAAVAAVVAMLVFETVNYDLLAAGRVVTGTLAAALRALGHLAITAALLVGGWLDLTLAVWSLTALHLTAAASLVLRLRRARRAYPAPDPAASAGRDSVPRLAGQLVRAGWLGQLSALSYLLLLRLDQVILEGAAGVAAVGIYALAAWAAELLWLVPEALNPLLVHSSAGDDPARRDHTAARAVRLGLGATAVAAVPLAALAPPVLGLLRDGAFAAAAAPLWALLPGVVAFAPGAVLAGDFIGRGRPTWNTQASAITVALNVVLCLLWIPSLGVLGAAWSSTVAYATGAAVMLWRFRRTTGLPWAEILVPRPGDLRR